MQASKAFTNFFKHDEEMDRKTVNLDDTIIYINSRIILWKYEKSIDDYQYNQYFDYKYSKKYMLFNLTERTLEFKDHIDIIDFKAPKMPSYSLEFLLSIAISAKNWISSDPNNLIIFHDSLLNVCFLCNIL